MKLGIWKLAALALLIGAWAHPSSCRADVLYYTGPDTLQYGPGNLPSVGGGYVDNDRFTLASDSTVTQIGWSEWLTSGLTPGTVDWAITTNLVGGGGPWTGGSNVVASGTATLSYTFIATVSTTPRSDVYWSTFGVNVPLSAGTYHLWLGNESNGSVAGWGYASNSGGDSQQWLGGNLRFYGGGQYSFELDGTTAVLVPEPPTRALFGMAAVTGLASLGWRRRKQLATA
jgi:hypothetical protein